MSLAFRYEADDDARARREESKRLLYVAVTRARDRLYLATILKEGLWTAGPGSLGSVLPDSIRPVFEGAALRHSARPAWTGESGRTYEFRICAAPLLASDSAAAGSEPPVAPPHDDFDELRDARAIERVSITASARDETDTGGAGEDGAVPASDAIQGSLVHRLFASPPPADPEAALPHAIRLIRDDERLAIGDVDGAARQALDIWARLRRRPEIAAILDAGEPLDEVPFSMRNPALPARLLRGAIDCLVRMPDGRVIVFELKTGRARPAHQRQLDSRRGCRQASVSRAPRWRGVSFIPGRDRLRDTPDVTAGCARDPGAGGTWMAASSSPRRIHLDFGNAPREISQQAPAVSRNFPVKGNQSGWVRVNGVAAW